MKDDFTDRIRDLRKEKGLTQQEVATALGVGQTTVANYEKGARLPDLSKLAEYADLFGVSVDYLLGRTDEIQAIPPEPLKEGGSPHEFKEYMDALLSCDRRTAVRILLELKEDGMPPLKIYELYMERALKKTGYLWERGDLPVWKEHCISEVTLEAMALLKEQNKVSRNFDKNLLALVPGSENHSIGLRMISDQLENEGFKVLFLGDNIPADNIIQAILENRSDAVLLSVTLPKHLDTLVMIISKIKETLGIKAPAILVGGQAFAGMRNVENITGADKYCRTYEEVVHTLNRIWA